MSQLTTLIERAQQLFANALHSTGIEYKNVLKGMSTTDIGVRILMFYRQKKLAETSGESITPANGLTELAIQQEHEIPPSPDDLDEHQIKMIFMEEFVASLHIDDGYWMRWRSALRSIVGDQMCTDKEMEEFRTSSSDFWKASSLHPSSSPMHRLFIEETFAMPWKMSRDHERGKRLVEIVYLEHGTDLLRLRSILRIAVGHEMEDKLIKKAHEAFKQLIEFGQSAVVSHADDLSDQEMGRMRDETIKRLKDM